MVFHKPLLISTLKPKGSLAWPMVFMILVIFFMNAPSAQGQGCSDAGFCTMGAMRPDQTYNKEVKFRLRALEVNYYRGESLATPIISAVNADFTFGIGENYAIQAKIPFQWVKGQLGETQGLGDISLSATRSFEKKDYTLGITLGAKVAVGNASKEGSNGDLPMYYQTSLGSYDLVLGGSLINDKWLLATGVQIPIIHRNENDFRWGHWKETEHEEYVFEYNLANQLQRAPDAMLRVERNWRYVNYNFGIGTLAIYRFLKDKRYDFQQDKTIQVAKTSGLSLNLLANAGYQINVRHAIKAVYALKLLAREINPDGLSRHAVLSVSYVYRF